MNTDAVKQLENCSEGVYALCGAGNLVLVYPFQFGDWGLADIHESFGLGKLEIMDNEITCLVMTRDELHRLEVSIHAQSFDFDQDFVELCLAMCAHGEQRAPPSITFFDNF